MRFWLPAFASLLLLLVGCSPKADFDAEPRKGNSPLSVKFSDKSVGVISSWTWDFGDGSVSDKQNPSHRYTKSGEYTVKLLVRSDYGDDSVLERQCVKVTSASSVVTVVTAVNMLLSENATVEAKNSLP